jgi:hypothetical protein
MVRRRDPAEATCRRYGFRYREGCHPDCARLLARDVVVCASSAKSLAKGLLLDPVGRSGHIEVTQHTRRRCMSAKARGSITMAETAMLSTFQGIIRYANGWSNASRTEGIAERASHQMRRAGKRWSDPFAPRIKIPALLHSVRIVRDRSCMP